MPFEFVPGRKAHYTVGQHSVPTSLDPSEYPTEPWESVEHMSRVSTRLLLAIINDVSVDNNIRNQMRALCAELHGTKKASGISQTGEYEKAPRIQELLYSWSGSVGGEYGRRLQFNAMRVKITHRWTSENSDPRYARASEKSNQRYIRKANLHDY